jgi:predicted nucleotide-binding protein (sugar kinase/HSP70/actin superfamily)
VNVQDTTACPIVAGAPKVMRAAFTKEIDFFAQRGIRYVDPALSFAEPNAMKRKLFEVFAPLLGVTEDESDFAADQGWAALRAFDAKLEAEGRKVLDEVERDGRVAVLMIGRPYHSDPGMNHGVLEEFQALGHPILSMRSIPKDRAFLDRFFADDLASGRIEHPLEINDVWPENYSANSAVKVWAAKFAARHPNVAVLDLSSFKCGHDAPTYGIIDQIISSASAPYSALHDIDANKPGGSIAIRVKTYAHRLALEQTKLAEVGLRKRELVRRIEEKKSVVLDDGLVQIGGLRRVAG